MEYKITADELKGMADYISENIVHKHASLLLKVLNIVTARANNEVAKKEKKKEIKK